MSPASPEYAIKLWLLSFLVLSSSDLRTEIPRMAALEVAMMTWSAVVNPNKISIVVVDVLAEIYQYMLFYEGKCCRSKARVCLMVMVEELPNCPPCTKRQELCARHV